MDAGQPTTDEQLLHHAKRQTKAIEGIYTILIIWAALSVVGAVYLLSS
jgi:hypothetical protein